MKQLDGLLNNHEEFRAHLYRCLRVALTTACANIKPSMTRTERVGQYVMALRRTNISTVKRGFSGRNDNRFQRYFVGVPDIPGENNPHVLAKVLQKELLITGNWVEPGILRSNNAYIEGSVMEKLTRKVLHDHEATQEEVPDFNHLTALLDSMKFCLDDSAKLVNDAHSVSLTIDKEFAAI